MRGRNDVGQSKRPIVLLCVMVVCLCLFLYFSGSNGQAGSAAFEYGAKLSQSLGWGSDGDGDDGSEESIFGTSDAGDVKLKRFSVCDDRHSELIPCLDRNLIYQMRMKLDLNLMEHDESHCPPPERRFNCLIPLPHGYKQRVDNIWNLLSPKIKPDTIRNIMEMKANFGSFAAALKEKDVWVMNVVPMMDQALSR